MEDHESRVIFLDVLPEQELIRLKKRFGVFEINTDAKINQLRIFMLVIVIVVVLLGIVVGVQLLNE